MQQFLTSVCLKVGNQLPHCGIRIASTYTGFMGAHCLGAGSQRGTTLRQKEISAYNIQLVTDTPQPAQV